MAADQQNTPELFPRPSTDKESGSFLPWIIAGVVVAVGVGLLFLFGGQKALPSNPGGAVLAPADAYAASLPITDVKMSESSNFAGGKVTYVDGHIANHGDKTVAGITVQVVPSVMHAGVAGSLAIADSSAAYVDTPAGGMVFEDAETVRSLTIRFDTIRGEARPANELAAIISEAAIRNERLA